jgi:hypothetical protein
VKLKNSGLIKAICINNCLIIIGIYVITSTAETHAGMKNNTIFPFDTLLNIACPGAGGNDSCPINISRYSAIIYFHCFGGYAICPENDYCDFLLPKEPLDSTSSHLIESPIDDYCQPHNSIHNKNIQYLVKNDSLTLFMAVDSVYGAVSTPKKIILVEFDTVSFLSKTAVIPFNKNNGSQKMPGIIQSSKIQYFDILGRILPSNVFNRNQGLFANKLIITNNRQILFKLK